MVARTKWLPERNGCPNEMVALTQKRYDMALMCRGNPLWLPSLICRIKTKTEFFSYLEHPQRVPLHRQRQRRV